MKQVLSTTVNVTSSDNANTRYIGFGLVETEMSGSNTEADRRWKIPFAGTLSDFVVEVGTAPGTGKSWTFTIRKNGADTAETVTISDSATSAVYSGSAVSFAAGDLVAVKVVPTSSPTDFTQMKMSVIYNETTSSIFAVPFKNVSSDTLSTSFLYYPISGFKHPGSSTKADVEFKIPAGGTIKSLYYSSENAPAAMVTVTLFKNGTQVGAADMTITSPASSASLTGLSITVAAGDTLCWAVKVASGTIGGGAITMSMAIQSDTDDKYFAFAGSNTALDASTTMYLFPTQASGHKPQSTTESVFDEVYARAIRFSNMYVNLSFAPTLGTQTFTLRKGNADTALSVAVASGTTTNNNTTDTVRIETTDTTSLEITPAVAIGLPTARISFLVDTGLEKSSTRTETATFTDTVPRASTRVLSELSTLLEELLFNRTNLPLRVKSGTYTGNATDNRSITGVGFTPKLVIIKAATNGLYDDPVVSFDSMGSDSSFVASPSAAPAANLIQAFESDGFQIGTGAQVNTNTTVYHYLAIGGDVSLCKTGSYTGDAADNRSITGVGFQPDFVLVKRAASTQEAFFRIGSMTGDNSAPFNNTTGTVTNRIQAMESDGFQVGTNAAINASAATYYYVAFRIPSNQGGTGSYTGNATDNRDITTAVAITPEIVFMRGNSTNEAIMRGASHTGDDTSILFNSKANAANNIQALNTNGFQVGTAGDVNTTSNNYFYFYIKQLPTAFQTEFITNVLGVTDTVVKTSTRLLSEASTFIDTVIKQATRVLGEVKSLTDVFEYTGSRSAEFLEESTLTDTIILPLIYAYTETMTLAGSVIKTGTKVISEVATLTDTITLVQDFIKERIFSEVFTATDTVIRVLTRTFSEVYTWVDTLPRTITRLFSEAVTWADTLIKQLTRTLTESATFTDTITFFQTLGRIFTEIFSLTTNFVAAITAFTLKRIGMIRGFKKDTNTNLGSRSQKNVGVKRIPTQTLEVDYNYQE